MMVVVTGEGACCDCSRPLADLMVVQLDRFDAIVDANSGDVLADELFLAVPG